MKKELQAVLLIVTFSIAAALRLSILGWMFIIAVGSVLVLGIAHFIIHFYSMNYLATRGTGHSLKIIFSHIFFLSIFIFQFDFDDSKSYSVLGYAFGIENDFLISSGSSIVSVSLICYVFLNISIIRNAKREKIKGTNIKYILPSVLISIFLPFLLISWLSSNKDLQITKEYEKTGEFNSVARALKKPEKVITLKINPYEASLLKFPTDILTLPNLKEIDFNEQKITEIPNDIYKLEKLEVLNLLDNNINEINPSICGCKNLRELRIGGDMIQSFPECLKRMKGLKHLSIQSNSVNELMEELKDFENLETAHFYLKKGILDQAKWRKIEVETGIKHKY